MRLSYLYTVLPLAVTFSCMSFSSPMTKEQLMDINSSNAQYQNELDEKEAWYNTLADRAQRHGYNHAFASVLEDQKRKIKSKERFYDISLSFDDISSLVQSGTAKGMFLVGGIVDEADAGTELIDTNIIALHDKAYQIIKYPYLSPSRPNWRDYLFKPQKLDLAPIPPNFLPKTDVEKKIWKENVDTGWERGLKAGFREVLSRWQALFADLRGMTRYWTAVELNIIEEATLAIETRPVEHDVFTMDGEQREELRLNPTVVRINSQSTFNPYIGNWDMVETQSNEDSRSVVRDAVINGTLSIQDITEAQKIIATQEFLDTQESIDNDNLFR
ncbi:type IV secretory system conjugative DNA transfer family protein [Vibrio sp. R78045]|uniref:type IV secretory system conjugative DNA transfer family protein n=1 Tax=Vibrio sp. R78045 TaxID=3093868 RepID=UPI0036F22B1B